MEVCLKIFCKKQKEWAMADIKCIGINGGGRMGKGLLRYLIAQRMFPKIIINFGREVGCGLEDITQYIINDTTYGNLALFCNGIAGGNFHVEIINEEAGIININDTRIHIKREHRDPLYIDWEDTAVVVDTTGIYNNPLLKIDAKGGSMRGHLEHPSVKKVLISAPFKVIKDVMPADAIMMIKGINDKLYNSNQHNFISAASCTTTALAPMVDALLQELGVQNMLSMTVTAVHAATGKEVLMDRVPLAGVDDPILYQAAGNNMFISTTGAAKALAVVLPEIKDVPQMAEAAREPGNTGSLAILTTDWANWPTRSVNNARKLVEQIFYQSSCKANSGLVYVNKKISRKDVFASPAAVTVAGLDTVIQLMKYGNMNFTRLRTFGWYDNEAGYTSRFTELLKKVVAEL
jgi:glyceraldehyde 3-phosphate dehydrogenase